MEFIVLGVLGSYPNFHPLVHQHFPCERTMFRVYPLVNIQKAIENSPFMLDFPMKSGDFP